MLKVAAKVIKR